MKKEGLYYTSLGGMNEKWTSGICGVVESVAVNQNGEKESVVVIKDVGGYDGRKSFGDVVFDALLPEVVPYLSHRTHDAYPEHPKAKALFLTHAHGDHMNLTPLLKNGYVLPTIYADPFTTMILRQDMANKNIPLEHWPEIHPIKPHDCVEIGSLKVTATAASHSVPTIGFWFQNDKAAIYDTGDCAVAPVNGYSTDPLHIEELKRSSPPHAVFFDGCDANLPGRSLTLDETYKAFQSAVQENLNSQAIAVIGGGNVDQMFMVAKLANDFHKTLILAGDSYQKSYILALQQANMSFSNVFPRLKIVDSSEHDVLKSLNPDETMVLTVRDFGSGSDLTRSLDGEKDVFRLSEHPTVFYNQGFISQSLVDRIQKRGGKTVEIIGASAHGKSADIATLLHISDGFVNVPTHCGREMAERLMDLMDAEMLPHLSINDWGNGVTFYIADGRISVFERKEPVWRSFKKILDNNDKEMIESIVQQKSEDLSRLKQALDFTNYQRAKKHEKQELWPDLSVKYPEMYRRIIAKRNLILSVERGRE